MTKDKLKGLVALGFLLTVIGFALLFYSVNLGISSAGNWLAKEGGADTSIYQIILEGYIYNFLAAGSILFGIGLWTIIFTFYKILSINE